jgi:hypothetical protein
MARPQLIHHAVKPLNIGELNFAGGIGSLPVRRGIDVVIESTPLESNFGDPAAYQFDEPVLSIAPR